jgi:hypothetical protein
MMLTRSDERGVTIGKSAGHASRVDRLRLAPRLHPACQPDERGGDNKPEVPSCFIVGMNSRQDHFARDQPWIIVTDALSIAHAQYRARSRGDLGQGPPSSLPAVEHVLHELMPTDDQVGGFVNIGRAHPRQRSADVLLDFHRRASSRSATGMP